MKNINHILTSQEKEIILNYFLFSKEGAKKEMSDFALQTIKKYSNMYSHVNSLEDLRNASRNLDVRVNLIWDEENNLTAQMYCLKHRRYKDSYAKMKLFRWFNSDMHMKDIHGETALLKLSKNMFNLRTINSILIGEDSVKKLNRANPNSLELSKLTKDSIGNMYGYSFFDFNNDGDNVIILSLKSLNQKLREVKVHKNAETIIDSLCFLENLKDAWFLHFENVENKKNKVAFNFIKDCIDSLFNLCVEEEKVNAKKYNFTMIRREISLIKEEVLKAILNIDLNESLSVKKEENKKIKI